MKRAGTKWFPAPPFFIRMLQIRTHLPSHPSPCSILIYRKMAGSCMLACGRISAPSLCSILIYRKMAPSSKTATTPVTPATAEPTVCSLYACETVMPENWLTTQK